MAPPPHSDRVPLRPPPHTGRPDRARNRYAAHDHSLPSTHAEYDTLSMPSRCTLLSVVHEHASYDGSMTVRQRSATRSPGKPGRSLHGTTRSLATWPRPKQR